MQHATSGPTTEKGARHGCPCPEKLADPGPGPDAEPVARGAGCLVLSGCPETGAATPAGGTAPYTRRDHRLQAQALARLTPETKKRPPMRWPFSLAGPE